MSEATFETLHESAASTEPRVIAQTVIERIKQRPLWSLGLAGLVGFVFGGGAASRTGAATLMLIGRVWLRRAATDALASAITNYGTTKRNGVG